MLLVILTGRKSLKRFTKKNCKKQIKMNFGFPKTKSFGGRMKVELDLPNYEIKADFKNATGADTSNFAKKTGLTNLKSDVHKLDIDILKNVPSNLINLKVK